MKRIIALCMTLLLTLSGCGESREYEKTIYAMDTVMTLTASGKGAKQAIDSAESEIFRLNALFDRGGEDSEIARLNAGEREVSSETVSLIGRALEISRATGGAFDITVAPLMDEWGFYDGKYRVPDEKELESALGGVGAENVSLSGSSVTLNEGTRLDLGGIAKGYASERVAEIFAENGVRSGIASLGGNVRTVGGRPDGAKWRVGVQDPYGEGYIGVISISDMAAVTSGDYQRFFESGGKRYHHILDPKTGRPAENGLHSVTVVCQDAVLADALSTALFVMGLDNAVEFWRDEGGFECVFVSDGGIYITAGLKDSFESRMDYTVLP